MDSNFASTLADINNRNRDSGASPYARDTGPTTRLTVDEAIDKASERHGVDPRLIRGIIHTESGYNPEAVSGKGATGLMQLMPDTARGMGYNPADLTDPEVNVDAGTRYFRQMLDRANGDVPLALRYYQGGFDQSKWGPVNAAYPDKVLSRARHFDETQGLDVGRGFSQSFRGALNDMTSGLSGYSSAAQGYAPEAAQDYAEHRRQMHDLAEQVRPQDQSFREALKGGPKEFFGDYLPYTIGSAAGSSAPALAGAATGFAVGGPVGAVVGGALPLLAQYFGSTWADNTAHNLETQGVHPDHATLDQIQSASGMSPVDFARVTGSALGRAGLEGAGDLLLGGVGGKFLGKYVGQLLPTGAAQGATDLLTKSAAGRIGTAAVGEGLTEAGDVPLSDLGSGRPWSGPEEYLDSFMGGLIGGGGLRGSYEAAKNPGGTIGSIKSGIDNFAGQTQWGQERAARQAQMQQEEIQRQANIAAEKQKAQQEADAAAEAERNRVPTPRELHEQMLAEHAAKLEAAKLPKATEDEYYAETEKYQNPEDLPPHLATFASYKAYRKKTDKAEQTKRNAEVGPVPTMQDALQRRKEIVRDRNLEPKKFYVDKNTGQMDMWGYEYGKGGTTQTAEAPPPPPKKAVEYPGTPDPRQMQTELDFGPEPLALPGGVEDALSRAQAAQSQEEQDAWLKTAILRDQAQRSQPQPQAPTVDALRQSEKAQQDIRDQVASAQGAVDTREAERAALSGERNQAYDALESQQAAEKDAQFLEMEKQRNLLQAGEPVFDPGALINQKGRTQWKSRPENKQTVSALNGPLPSASSKPIAGKKLESGYQSGRTSIDLMSSEAAPVAPTRRTNSTVTRESQITPEAAAVLEAQNKELSKGNTLAAAFAKNKQAMLDKAISAFRAQGAQIEDGDKLQWTGRGWSLFPREYRGRPPAGHFYADMFNQAGDKIGKVLRPDPPTPPTPPEGNDDAENSNVETSQNGQREEGNFSAEKKGRRRGTRRVSEAQGQSETNDATQGQEISNAQQDTQTSQANGSSSAQSEVRKSSGRSRKSGKGVQPGGQENGSAQEEADLASEIKRLEGAETDGNLDDKDVDALIKKIADMQDRKRQEDEAVDLNKDNSLGEDSGYFHPGDVEWMATSNAANGELSESEIQSVLDEYQRLYGDRLGVKFNLYAGPENAFGSEANIPANTKGFYHSTKGIVGVFRRSVGSVRDLQRTLDHELFGHFGLNTLTPAEKLDLLGSIARSQGNPFVKRAFEQVKKEQAQLAHDDFKVAEEVFARAAENVDSFWSKVFDAIVAKIAPVLRKLRIFPGEMTLAEIRNHARDLATGIRKGTARQQTVPHKADVQFRSDFNSYTDKVLDTTLGEAWGKTADALSKLVVSANNTAFLAKWFPDMSSLQDIHASETKMQASQGKNANATMDKVDDIRNLPKAERTKLFGLMLDSTKARMHPDRPLSDETNAHIPNNEESIAMHQELSARYESLQSAGQKAYKETRDLFQSMFDQRTKALFALSDRLLTDKKREQFKENINRLVKGMPGPYFPLTRFGNYVAVWKSKEYAQAQKDHDTKRMEELKSNPEHYAVSFHETSFQAQRALKKKVAEMGERSALGENESYAREREFYDGGVTMDLQPLLEKMQDAVETTLGKENSRDAKNALAEIFVSSLADTNVLKSTLKRENVEGVDPSQMLRAIARHGSAQAFHISRLEHMADIQSALKRLRVEDSVAVNKGQRFSLYNTVAGALTGMYTADPNSVASRAINGANFLFYNGRLALSPAFWVTNALAPITVSVPYMNGRHKLNTVMGVYRDAALDAVKVVMPTGLKDATRFSLLDAITGAKNVSGDERDMLIKLMDEGLIDENQIRELSNVADGGIGLRDDLARYLGAIPHRVEALNRVSTALTAYRLELAKTHDPVAATQYAIQTTSETQVNYTTAGTPYLLRKNGWLGAPSAKIITQFMRYQLGMVQLIGHNFREAWGSKTVDSKTQEEARRKFYALLAMHTAMTGASGWFGANAATAVLQWVVNAFYDDDEEPDLEQEGKKLIDDIFGKELSTGIRKGLPAMFGLDLSSRLGMGDMLSIRKENPFKGEAKEAKAQLVDASPALSNMYDWWSWAQKGFAPKNMPITLVSSIAKASDLATKGMTNAQGIVKIQPKEFSPVDVIIQGLGFSPTRVAESYAAQSVVREREKVVASAREELIKNWNTAMNGKDQGEITKARKKITEFNGRHKGQHDVLITPDTLTKSRRQRLSREHQMNEYGVYIPKGGAWRNDMTNAEE